MTNEAQKPRLSAWVRRCLRLLAVLPAAAVMLATQPAMADAPELWEDAPDVAALEAILVLVLIPLGLFVLITLLVYVPSMSRGEGYHPGQAWRGESEWFGGPRTGVEALEPGEQKSAERGGSSGRW